MAESDRARWDARYRGREEGPGGPSPFVAALDPVFPRRGRALDVAGGAGRNALWLARRGLDVTLTDISGVALEIAAAHAAAQDLRVTGLRLDLETEPLPTGPWSVIVCVHYLWRPLFRAFPALLAEGGLLVVAHPTRTNLERHARPGPQYLLEEGELPTLVPALTIVAYEEGWRNDVHEARLVARRPAEFL
ncbi:MAG: methyltransferase domain-containing protein [Isosphaeraceae bacterium]|nr:methyltransferase domain-containing protein [Isosphaeraceae bacterium]